MARTLIIPNEEIKDIGNKKILIVSNIPNTTIYKFTAWKETNLHKEPNGIKFYKEYLTIGEKTYGRIGTMFDSSNFPSEKYLNESSYRHDIAEYFSKQYNKSYSLIGDFYSDILNLGYVNLYDGIITLNIFFVNKKFEG